METFTSSHRVNYGSQIIPIKRIEIFSAEEWEDFVNEWLDIIKPNYHSTEKHAGAGDKGIDVAAYADDPKKNKNYTWDCYQCKHYDRPLEPSRVYIEFAKIIYYSYTKEYPVPRKYYFVAPKECGTSLSKLLRNSDQLKAKLKEQWLDKCQKEISSAFEVPLTDEFLKYFEAFDFTIFDKVQRKVLVDQHKSHPNHLTRFGGGLIDRPKITDKDVPAEIQSHETVYISNLLNAYQSTGVVTVKKATELTGMHAEHLKRARNGFHFAEQLRVLYRDSLPVNTFEDFQEEIYTGIINTVDSSHTNGFEKVKAVEDKSHQVSITSNPLKDVSKPQDRVGICHQLSNNGKIKW